MFTCFNVGAIAGAHAAKNATPRYLAEFERYIPEPRPVAGMVLIESSADLSVERDFSRDGVEIRFRNLAEVNKLIEKLTRLRDDMIEKSREENEL